MKRLLLVVWGAVVVVASAAENGTPFLNSTNRPMLAIWRDNEGVRPDSKAPYLRIAIWADGRVVFAKDPAKWSHELLAGRIDAARITELRKAIEATGVFELKGNCYLVPDGPMDCVMLDFGAKQQMLYWDEVETAGYGINIAPREHHLKFMKSWKEVNQLALKAIPQDSRPHPERFQRPPQSWRLKKPIQSE